MNRLPSVVRQHLAGLRMLLIFTVITGIIYPVVMWGVAQVAFNHQANGSLVSYHGRVIGSSLLCQEFVDAKGNPLPQYFQPRPSYAIVGWALTEKDGKWVVEGTGPNNYGCNPLYSSASNLGPNNPAQLQFVKQQQAQISAFDHVPISKIPPDAVTASGSGPGPRHLAGQCRHPGGPGRRRQAYQPGARSRPSSSSTRPAGPRVPRRAGGQRAAAEPRAR